MKISTLPRSCLPVESPGLLFPWLDLPGASAGAWLHESARRSPGWTGALLCPALWPSLGDCRTTSSTVAVNISCPTCDGFCMAVGSPHFSLCLDRLLGEGCQGSGHVQKEICICLPSVSQTQASGFSVAAEGHKSKPGRRHNPGPLGDMREEDPAPALQSFKAEVCTCLVFLWLLPKDDARSTKCTEEW